MNKTFLVAQLAKKFGSHRQAALAVNTVFEQIVRAVVTGDRVSVTGFGTFAKVNGSAIQFNPGSTFKNLVAGEKKLPNGSIDLNALQRTTAKETFLTAELFEVSGGYQKAVHAVNTVFEEIIRAVTIEGGFVAYGFGFFFTEVNDPTVQFKPGHTFKDLVAGRKMLPNGSIFWNAPKGRAAKKTASKATRASGR